MARPVNYVDLNRCNEEDLIGYKTKAEGNAAIFHSMFGGTKSSLLGMGASLVRVDRKNKDLMQRISDISGVPLRTVKMINLGDEAMNFGCTSVAMDGVIGQTMDLYDVELSIVREEGALYATFPPYLTLMGMNKKLAFCTNFLQSSVGRGVPVSQIRRNILRQEDLEGVVDYLGAIKRANSANFLISDGERVLNVETTRKECRVFEEKKAEHGRFNAHTNHLIQGDILDDTSCPRLSRAVDMLADGAEIEEVLDDKEISIPIEEGFGSIIKVVMDVKEGMMRYKDPRMEDYEELQV